MLCSHRLHGDCYSVFFLLTQGFSGQRNTIMVCHGIYSVFDSEACTISVIGTIVEVLHSLMYISF